MSYWRSLFQLERCSYILWSWSPWIWSSRKPCFLCVVQLLSIWYYALRLNTYRLQLHFIKQFSRTVDSTWFCAFFFFNFDFFCWLKRINLGKHYKKERVNIFFGLCRTKDNWLTLKWLLYSGCAHASKSARELPSTCERERRSALPLRLWSMSVHFSKASE